MNLSYDFLYVCSVGTKLSQSFHYFFINIFDFVVEMKNTADFLASYMCQSGLPTTTIHGDRSGETLLSPLKDRVTRFKNDKPYLI